MKKIINEPLNEKLKFLSGVDCWHTYSNNNIEALRMSDGPHGLRYVYKEENYEQISKANRVYPSLSTLSCSWNKDTLYSIGHCLALDCIEENVDIILAPGVNLKRHPFCGRNFEYFSEDSLLSGKLAASYINGIQNKGIAACIKHFACNNRERDRFFESSEVDIRALNEEYLKAFKIAIEESNPLTLMCSYNPVNGIYASENPYLLTTILRSKYNYNGVVISDWGAVRNRAISLKSGLDLAMPYQNNFLSQLEEGINENYINEEDVNRSVARIDNLKAILKERESLRTIDYTKEERLNKIVEAVEDSIVLLKNENDILPLKNSKENILIIGDYAINPLCGGDGSSRVNPLNTNNNLVEELKIDLPASNISFESGFITRYNLIQPFGMKKALLEAKKADKIILCVGTTLREEKEESDKDTYRLNENIYDLIVELNKINENIILVLYTGGPVELYEVNNLVKGIVYAGLGGEGVSKALSHVLTNKVCPSGKLSESFIYFKEDSYTSKGNYFYEKYDEGVLVGYKNYLTNDIPVLYEFGFGLSYATFKYSNLKIKDLGSLNFEISFDVTNDSDIDAKNVTEIYIGNRLRMVETSVKSLVNFDKTFFKAHETKNIKVKLNKDSFSYFNVMLNDFYVEDGVYDIYVSTSLTVDELKGQIEIKEGKFKYSRF